MKETLQLPKCLTNFHLKVIAIVSMLLDHFAYIPLASVLSHAYDVQEGSVVYDDFRQNMLLWVSEHEYVLWNFNDVLHWIGRLAFPLFCFMIVEGFIHTRNKGKYAFRLGLFALISEIPYDMAFNNCLLTLKNNNVFFSLLIGFMMIWAIWTVQQKKHSKVINISALAAFTAVALILVGLLDASYGPSGVFTILIIYLLKDKPVLSIILSVAALTILNISFIELFALPAAILVAMYNKERGPSIKYFFYGFYPAHLIIFALLAVWLGNMDILMEYIA